VAKLSVVSVSFRSTGFLRELFRNLHQKAGDPQAIQALVVDNTGGEDADLATLKSGPFSPEIVPFSPAETNGSRAHAKALDFALARVDSDYTLIVDPDVHVFRQGWDRACRDALAASRAVAVGAPYPEWKVGKYHDFPSPIFCFFETARLKALGAGFEPFGSSRLSDARDFAVRQVGRLGNLLTRRAFERSQALRRYARWSEHRLGVFGPDTGWRIAERARERDERSVVFRALLNGAKSFGLPALEGLPAFQSLVADYELYTLDGQLFMTHKYGTGSRPWRTARGGDVAFWRQCIASLEALQAQEPSAFG
jgi:hypothetical protein